MDEKNFHFSSRFGALESFSFAFLCVRLNLNDRRININSTQCICSHFIIHTVAIMVKCQILKALPSLNVSKTITAFNSNRREMRFRYKSNLLFAHTYTSSLCSPFLWLENEEWFWFSIYHNYKRRKNNLNQRMDQKKPLGEPRKLFNSESSTMRCDGEKKHGESCCG